jgi:hypothetical protein
MPDDGAVVSYLDAETNGYLGGKSSAIMEVIDHDTGVKLLGGTVGVERTRSGRTSCARPLWR